MFEVFGILSWFKYQITELTLGAYIPEAGQKPNVVQIRKSVQNIGCSLSKHPLWNIYFRHWKVLWGKIGQVRLCDSRGPLSNNFFIVRHRSRQPECDNNVNNNFKITNVNSLDRLLPMELFPKTYDEDDTGWTNKSQEILTEMLGEKKYNSLLSKQYKVRVQKNWIFFGKIGKKNWNDRE